MNCEACTIAACQSRSLKYGRTWEQSNVLLRSHG